MKRSKRLPNLTASIFIAAIRSGINPASAQLHPGMPHYRLTPDQMRDLLSYLKALGTERDWDPGISEKSIRIGAALPLSGPLRAVGEDIRQMLRAYFDRVNSRQGIYGRVLELVVRDSRGEPTATLEAVWRLVQDDQVFAFAGNFEPADSWEANEFLRQAETPVVCPSTLSPSIPTPPNPWVFYLLPGFADQAKALVDFAVSRSAGAPIQIAVVASDNPFDLDGLEGLKAQAAVQGISGIAEVRYSADAFDGGSIAASLADKEPDYVVFFGNPTNFLAMSQAMEVALPRARLLSSAIVAGEMVFQLSPSMAARTALAYPGLPPSEVALTEFLETAQRSSLTVHNSAYQRSAFAAAAVLVESLKLAGRDLTRSGLMGALENLRDFRTGVLPPVTFGPNRRIGAIGACIVAIDPTRRQYVPLTGWLTPAQKE